MSQRVFTIADTHFFHDKALLFRKDLGVETVEAMNEELIYRWNHTVRPQDIVWHLGDVAICSGDLDKKQGLGDVMLRLNGYLHLVMGNHDRMDLAGQYFDEVHGAKERKLCIMTHIPVVNLLDSAHERARFRLNIHGHTHHERVGTQDIESYDAGPVYEGDEAINVGFKTVFVPDPWYYCVSVEQTEYAPVPFADIIYERFEK